MKPGMPKKRFVTAQTALVFALLLVVILLSFPVTVFQVNVFTKKASNTFAGDDKYIAVSDEVRLKAEEYREKGFEVTTKETVTERTNSKGDTTSLITFSILQEIKKTGWDFLKGNLSSSRILIAILSLAAFSVVLTASGMAIRKARPSFHKKGDYLFAASGGMLLIAIMLVPVFVMRNTIIFSRKLSLYTGGTLTEGSEAYYTGISNFLFGNGLASEDAASVLKGLTFHSTAFIWLTLPVLIAMLLIVIQLQQKGMKHHLLRILLYGFIIAVCVITLYPYYVMLVTGFRSMAETNDMYFLHMFPTKWIWSNFTDIIKRNVLVYLKNSLLIAGGATAIAMLCGIPAAYTMARRNFLGKKLFLGFVIMSQMFSPVVLLIGIAQLMSAMKLNDSIVGLMLINAAFNQAFAIWLLRGTFVSISPEMEQAALIDGCNTFQSLVRVLLPMAAPGIVTTLIFVFINAWNEYTISTVLISTASNKPITVGITTFSSLNMIEWQYLFAASLLATIPVVILFMCIEKHLVSGLTSGGVKG